MRTDKSGKETKAMSGKETKKEFLGVVAMTVLLVVFGTVVGYLRCDAADVSPNCTEIYSTVFATLVIVSGFLALRSKK
jgi:hypothetical protein